ncbi:hypothetical protein PR048_023216 [Dryococelus australis]|uniref:Uncharacterized protein n=1 Tax=Dryococelus australis TaxID=614101 RepID=A0ABQ9GTF5_9NEOP|nr:hypothetical protein PR048_023216 [Dryococelus australis]
MEKYELLRVSEARAPMSLSVFAAASFMIGRSRSYNCCPSVPLARVGCKAASAYRLFTDGFEIVTGSSKSRPETEHSLDGGRLAMKYEYPIEHRLYPCREYSRYSERVYLKCDPDPAFQQTDDQCFELPRKLDRSREPMREKRGEYGAAPEYKGRGSGSSTRKPMAPTDTIPIGENPGIIPLGIKPGSLWWEASRSVRNYGHMDIPTLRRLVLDDPERPPKCSPQNTVAVLSASRIRIPAKAFTFYTRFISIRVVVARTTVDYRQSRLIFVFFTKAYPQSIWDRSVEWLGYSPPGRVAHRFSHVRIVTDDAAGRRVLSGISRFPRPRIPALLHSHPISPSSALKILDVKSRPNLFTYIRHGTAHQTVKKQSLWYMQHDENNTLKFIVLRVAVMVDLKRVHCSPYRVHTSRPKTRKIPPAERKPASEIEEKFSLRVIFRPVICLSRADGPITPTLMRGTDYLPWRIQSHREDNPALPTPSVSKCVRFTSVLRGQWPASFSFGPIGRDDYGTFFRMPAAHSSWFASTLNTSSSAYQPSKKCFNQERPFVSIVTWWRIVPLDKAIVMWVELVNS